MDHRRDNSWTGTGSFLGCRPLVLGFFKGLICPSINCVAIWEVSTQPPFVSVGVSLVLWSGDAHSLVWLFFLCPLTYMFPSTKSLLIYPTLETSCCSEQLVIYIWLSKFLHNIILCKGRDLLILPLPTMNSKFKIKVLYAHSIKS